MADEKEVMAGLRVLIAVAKADGRIDEAEKRAIETTLADRSQDLKALLEENVELDAQLAAVVSPEVRRETYRAAVVLTHADGECSSDEQEMLDRIRAGWDISADEAKRAKSWISAARAKLTPSAKAIVDPVQRTKALDRSILSYSVMAAVLGAFPIPGAAIVTDIAVIFLQRHLVATVGLYYGRILTTKEIVSLYGAIAGVGAARIAVSNIVKLIPIWGAAAAGAAAFTTTWALGKVVDRHLANEGKLSGDDLAAEFKAAKKEGAEAYERNKQAIADKAETNQEKLDALGADLKAGRISQEEFEEKVADLV